MTYINRSTLISTVIFGIFLLCSCNKNTHAFDKKLQYTKYLSSKKKLNHNNYKDAIKELESLNAKNPCNPYKNQIYFDLIYAYYKSINFPLTFKTIDDFIQSNPKHPNTDYPLYISGLSNMELDKNNLFNKLLKSNYFKKNSEYAYKAFRNFSQLINEYPNSQYANDAHKRLIYLKNRIAKHELSIIQYYDSIGAYISVINRSEDMLRYFPDTKATHDALQYMYVAYKKLNLTNQSDKVMKIIHCIHNTINK